LSYTQYASIPLIFRTVKNDKTKRTAREQEVEKGKATGKKPLKNRRKKTLNNSKTTTINLIIFSFTDSRESYGNS
jgi:hypothetical protein